MLFAVNPKIYLIILALFAFAFGRRLVRQWQRKRAAARLAADHAVKRP